MSRKTLIRGILVLIFIAVTLTPLFYFRWGVYPYTLSKQLFFQSTVEIIFFLWLALAIVEPRFRPKRTPFTLALAGLLFVLTLTAVLGVDPSRSFWSTYERTIGVVAIYHFAALALALSSLAKEIPWKKLFYASLAAAFLIDIVAFIQLYIPSFLLEENPGNRPGATFGNPTFLSEYLLFNIFIAAYLLLDRWRSTGGEKGERRGEGKYAAEVFLCASLIFNVYTIFRAQTRGDILGLGAGLLVLMLFFAVRSPQLRWRVLSSRKFYAGLLFAILLAGSVFWLTRKNDLWSKFPGLGRFREISFSSADAGGIGPRLIALKAAWRGFLDKPVFGWGPENFNIVFNKYYDPKALEANYQETRFDKPHNLAMEYLVTGGVALTAAFLALLAAFLYEANRLRDRRAGTIMIAIVASYFVSEFFAFDTVGPLLMLYLLFGFVDGKYNEHRAHSAEHVAQSTEQNKGRSTPHGFLPQYAFYLFFGVALITVYSVNVLTLQASYYQYLAFTDIVGGRRTAGINNFKDAIDTWSPYKWNFERDYAAEAAQIYFYNPGYISEGDVMSGVRAMEDARDAHPLDAYNHYALIDVYNQVSALDTKKFTALAEKEAASAFALSPDRQEIYFSLAKTKNIEGDNPAALAVLKKALDLDPNIPDAHFYYGLLAFATGDPLGPSVSYDVARMTLGYNEVERAMQMGRQWKTYYEPRTVADYLADFADATRDVKHLDEAVDLYKTALAMRPGDAETEIKLGVAYFRKGDLASARQYLSDAKTKVNFQKSGNYVELEPILERLGIR